ncbi:uncharacterized protein LOC143784222 [Ranitomeya variabilis]|uniref:uncharacterized protein LOC143784222 n=1 Tax=Ranitomeya variabilis TaxID=490064 RepID=UPI004057A298
MGDVDLKQRILTYQLEGSSLGGLGYTRILLQFCGLAGHGKSSLINSFIYTLNGGKFSVSAPVAKGEENKGGGCTVERLPYGLTDIITMVDNRGFGKADSFEREEVYSQMANIQPLNEHVKWNWTYEERMKLVTTAKRNITDLLVPIYVHSALRQIQMEEKAEILEFLQNVQKITGFLPFIVLTNKIRGDADKLRSQFVQLGMENIFEVENYTADNHVKSPEKEKTFLTILTQILDYVDFVASEGVPTMDSPEEEHAKRVQMILKVAHDNDIERKKKQWLAENVQPEKKARWPCNIQ